MTSPCTAVHLCTMLVSGSIGALQYKTENTQETKLLKSPWSGVISAMQGRYNAWEWEIIKNHKTKSIKQGGFGGSVRSRHWSKVSPRSCGEKSIKVSKVPGHEALLNGLHGQRSAFPQRGGQCFRGGEKA